MEKNKSLISHDESYSFTLINIEGDALKKVNNDKINAYYSLYNKKRVLTEMKISLFF
ncbi:hypothetical protein [Proteus penneri]|uniref:hypothetical protein n=1 Tax=Proteus penneri TaxID=102862 RepID=UPI0034D6F88A